MALIFPNPTTGGRGGDVTVGPGTARAKTTAGSDVIVVSSVPVSFRQPPFYLDPMVM